MNRKRRSALGWWLQLIPGCVFASVALDHMPFAASFPAGTGDVRRSGPARQRGGSGMNAATLPELPDPTEFVRRAHVPTTTERLWRALRRFTKGTR